MSSGHGCYQAHMFLIFNMKIQHDSRLGASYNVITSPKRGDFSRCQLAWVKPISNCSASNSISFSCFLSLTLGLDVTNVELRLTVLPRGDDAPCIVSGTLISALFTATACLPPRAESQTTTPKPQPVQGKTGDLDINIRGQKLTDFAEAADGLGSLKKMMLAPVVVCIV